MGKNKNKNNQGTEELENTIPSSEENTEETTTPVEENTESTESETTVEATEATEESTVSTESSTESVEQEESSTPSVEHSEDSSSVEQPEDSSPSEASIESEEENVDDKYAVSRSIDQDTSYHTAASILANASLTIDDKINELSNSTSIDYKMIIEAFKDYDEVVQLENLNISNPKQFAAKIAGLYQVFNTVLSLPDQYECFLKIQMLVLLVKKYLRTSLQPSFYCLYAEDYPGSETEYLNYTYILSTLIARANTTEYDRVRKTIDFSRNDFKHGRRLEEFVLSLQQ